MASIRFRSVAVVELRELRPVDAALAVVAAVAVRRQAAARAESSNSQRRRLGSPREFQTSR